MESVHCVPGLSRGDVVVADEAEWWSWPAQRVESWRLFGLAIPANL